MQNIKYIIVYEKCNNKDFVMENKAVKYQIKGTYTTVYNKAIQSKTQVTGKNIS